LKKRDWDFAFGNLGDPLADIQSWMLPPHPQWVTNKLAKERITKDMTKEFMFSITKKDLIVQTFRSGGKGGQHQNKTSSGVRIIHNPSGARGESREERSQLRNKHTALKRLTETVKFKTWCYMKMQEIISGETIDDKVERDMHPDNLKIEYLSSDGTV